MFSMNLGRRLNIYWIINKKQLFHSRKFYSSYYHRNFDKNSLGVERQIRRTPLSKPKTIEVPQLCLGKPTKKSLATLAEIIRQIAEARISAGKLKKHFTNSIRAAGYAVLKSDKKNTKSALTYYNDVEAGSCNELRYSDFLVENVQNDLVSFKTIKRGNTNKRSDGNEQNTGEGELKEPLHEQEKLKDHSEKSDTRAQDTLNILEEHKHETKITGGHQNETKPSSTTKKESENVENKTDKIENQINSRQEKGEITNSEIDTTKGSDRDLQASEMNQENPIQTDSPKFDVKRIENPSGDNFDLRVPDSKPFSNKNEAIQNPETVVVQFQNKNQDLNELSLEGEQRILHPEEAKDVKQNEVTKSNLDIETIDTVNKKKLLLADEEELSSKTSKECTENINFGGSVENLKMATNPFEVGKLEENEYGSKIANIQDESEDPPEKLLNTSNNGLSFLHEPGSLTKIEATAMVKDISQTVSNEVGLVNSEITEDSEPKNILKDIGLGDLQKGFGDTLEALADFPDEIKCCLTLIDEQIGSSGTDSDKIDSEICTQSLEETFISQKSDKPQIDSNTFTKLNPFEDSNELNSDLNKSATSTENCSYSDINMKDEKRCPPPCCPPPCPCCPEKICPPNCPPPPPPCPEPKAPPSPPASPPPCVPPPCPSKN